MSSSAVLQQCARTLVRSASGSSRQISTSAVARGGGGPFDYHYIHAPRMYDVAGMPNKHLVYGSMCTVGLLGGFFIPLYAISHSQKKTMG
ncbi:hypothetical protein PPROV_000861700 [Pycnococcus provasolii]|uniref:Uncharacterized protein n=1 Tax=Pycnococcus provasolii TaxID=41880 RepID=A0A830HRY8_9CHLO|nr:hypothetical protein PPROV_000861700 [Pycnococcus provasolii]|mmetsp:Transcript_11135/g.29572  ORF Transcript_11135/g.29572 Transcript_11135/m.29572 type:complete len:90 (+) Transcript_11135:48-317(+)|eukprot:CAMPEP_0206122198 /NCGR_PEP_ID=MMETSP1472-20131121/1960_1 /ASSEMBLY_ACC=CAM_ASM_001108 /TAXON_ID=41880 /ORGANISM="Pycnococcus provasolii, Strain RCC251" /LENGTH=89 /DNA_ID=CAMNT_0053512659 /DNA_START=25 /DNA_END=294 /DNA_ORIENTATION=-